MRSQSSSPEREVSEVDELMDESPAPSRTRSVTPPPAPEPSKAETSRPMPKLQEPFSAPAFKVPEISSPARPVPAFSPSPASAAPSYMDQGFKDTPPPAPAPTFKPTAHKPSAPLPEIENSTLASVSRPSVKASKKEWSAAQKKVFQLSTGSLPTFVFKISSRSPGMSPLAKKAALRGAMEHFKFDLEATSTLR